MRLYTCGCCGNLLYFENITCTRCHATLGFLSDRLELVALESLGDGLWQPITSDDTLPAYRMCQNYHEHNVCNWMVPADETERFCVACRLNRTIPDLSIGQNKWLWAQLEVEKRRLVYALLSFALPVESRLRHPQGLAFDFLGEGAVNNGLRVMTGHAQGLITLNIAEADPVARQQMRQRMGERYRTILGHFRHESGHYYWDRLVRDTAYLACFRGLFGDERLNYRQALSDYYDQGAPLDWHKQHVSMYASSHPWEDWAETWAHYLHIMDTLETAGQFGLSVNLNKAGVQLTSALADLDIYQLASFRVALDNWLPLNFALNSLNRSMGHEDAYPFVLSPKVMEKLEFVHSVVHHINPPD